MKEKFKQFEKNLRQIKWLMAALLALIIIVQLFNITNDIFIKKKGYHSDEIYSYGLSNSFYMPFISLDHIFQEDYINLNQWVSGEVLREYITVQPDEVFRYDSVWYNQSTDRHPPLYYAVMHTICSFFPNTFSPVFGYLINYICFIVTQIFLFKLARNLLQSKYLALLSCVLWGFSAGAIDLTIFIRMYAMLVMWTVIFIYLHSKLCELKENADRKIYLSLIIITVCGALTHHTFLLIAFFTAVFFCIYYLIKKQVKNFLKYGFSILGGTVLSIVIFPATISHMFKESSDAPLSLFFPQLQLTSRYIARDILSVIKGSEPIFLLQTIPVILLALIICCTPVIFLLRDKPKVQKFLCRIKAIPPKVKTLSFQKIRKGLWHDIKNIPTVFYLMLICVLAICAITSYTILFLTMMYVNRYLFIIYPPVVLVFVYLLYFIFTRFKYRKAIVSVILAVIIIYSLPGKGVTYFFDEERTIDSINELTADSDCIFVETLYDQMWLIDTLPIELYNVDKVFVTYMMPNEGTMQRIADLNTGKNVYLFVDEHFRTVTENADQFIYMNENTKVEELISVDEYFEPFKNLPYVTMFRYIGSYTIFERTYAIYRLA